MKIGFLGRPFSFPGFGVLRISERKEDFDRVFCLLVGLFI